MLNPDRPKNRILATLPATEYERLLPKLTPVQLQHSQVLYQSGEVMKFVYFPNASMVSLISSTATGESVEVGVVGFEGMAGISAVLGVDESPFEALVQYPNGALRITVKDLREEFNRGGALQARLLRYAQALLLQTSQVAACNRLHTISERLARWLLMSQDRCLCDELPFTQEFLSLMLGTRRPSVTEAAVILQTEGCIHYRRGLIKITDRDGLLDHSCHCYPVIKTEFDLLNAALAATPGAYVR
jgi:CRP-like cAMP-binding protein